MDDVTQVVKNWKFDCPAIRFVLSGEPVTFEPRMTAIDFQKINSLKSKNSFEDILISAKKKPSKEYMNDNTKLFKINSGKTARQHINMP
jgi:hypothetical protein